VKTLALFDFDGTISNRDSMIDFIRFSVSKRRLLTGVFRLTGVIAGYVFGAVTDADAKQLVLTHFFGGRDYDELKTIADEYAAKRINKIIRPKALQEIKRHLSEGGKIAIVSASVELWLQKWCDDLGLTLIATKPHIINGCFSGSLASPNCKGEEKIRRIKEIYDLSEFDAIYAYGDSPADRPMLSLSTHSFYKPFR
jgi:HAD superfamily hydrolase (TIGR01490 family)